MDVRELNLSLKRVMDYVWIVYAVIALAVAVA